MVSDSRCIALSGASLRGGGLQEPVRARYGSGSRRGGAGGAGAAAAGQERQPVARLRRCGRYGVRAITGGSAWAAGRGLPWSPALLRLLRREIGIEPKLMISNPYHIRPGETAASRYALR
jgi:hypothetical protein